MYEERFMSPAEMAQLKIKNTGSRAEKAFLKTFTTHYLNVDFNENI